MAKIYKNTPENQKRFEDFWNDTPTAKISTIANEEMMSCVSIVRETVHHIDRCKENGVEHLSIDDVRELLMDCLRGEGI